jgi:hypothetical protein
MSIQGTTVGRNYLCHQPDKVSFVALAAALRRGYDARVSYLQAPISLWLIA